MYHRILFCVFFGFCVFLNLQALTRNRLGFDSACHSSLCHIFIFCVLQSLQPLANNRQGLSCISPLCHSFFLRVLLSLQYFTNNRSRVTQLREQIHQERKLSSQFSHSGSASFLSLLFSYFAPRVKFNRTEVAGSVSRPPCGLSKGRLVLF